MKKPLQRTPFFVRLFNWEFWPFNLVYTPVFVYWAWLSMRARHILFFTGANPGIPTGGLVGESKADILAKIPAEWRPRDLRIRSGTATKEVHATMRAAGLDFPIFAKPDIGERGLLVRRIDTLQELSDLLDRIPADFILQEYVDFPIEVSVLHYRYPDSDRGAISSYTLKDYLAVTGDGMRSVDALIRNEPRALLQRKRLLAEGVDLQQVPAAGEQFWICRVGNHSKGCRFRNGNALISPALVATFDRIAERLEGICYGRYDIKCSSIEDLEAGRNFKILEINGVKSEPTHIYDPQYPIRRFYADLFAHWRIIYRLSLANHRRGVPYMSIPVAWRRFRELIRYHRRLRAAC